MRIKFKNIVYRFLTPFIASLAVIFLSGTIIYNMCTGEIKDEVFSSVQQQLNYSCDKLNDEIQTIYQSSYNIFSDYNVNMLIIQNELLSTYQTTQFYQRIIDTLSSLGYNSRYIESSAIYIPQAEIVFHSTGYYEELDHTKYETFYKLYDINHPYRINTVNDIPYLVVSKLTYTKNDIMIVVRLSSSAMQNLFDLSGSHSQGDTALISDDSSILLHNKKYLDTDKFISLIEKVNLNKFHSYKGSDYTLLSVSSPITGTTAVRYLKNSAIYKNTNTLSSIVTIFLIFTLGIFAFMIFYFYAYILSPISTLVKSFQQIESGDLSIRVYRKQNDEFSYLYEQFNLMLEKLQSLIDEIYVQRLLTEKAEYKQLQAQIKPHFLFNGFLTLRSMIKTGDYDTAELFCSALSEYFEYITRSTQDEIVFKSEYDHAINYLKIQSLRFEDRLTTEIEPLPKELYTLRVPRLILQPLFENIFEHGLKNKTEAGTIKLSFENNEAFTDIIIEDNGTAITDGIIEQLNRSVACENYTGEITALINIHRRIKHYFNNLGGLSFYKSRLGGLMLRITIYPKEISHETAIQDIDC